MTCRGRLIVGAVLAVVLAGVLPACTGSDSDAGGAPSTSEIAALLRSHGDAVRARDRAKFLAGVSDAARDRAYRAAQSSAFGNLAKLSFTTWKYSRGPEVDASVQRMVRAQRGADAVVVRVELSYAIARADASPHERVLYWTLERQGGRVVVAADNALATVGGQSWQGPWDFGALDVVKGKASLVLVHSEDADLAASIRDSVDAAVTGVTAVVGTDWPRYVLAYAPTDQSERQAAFGAAASLGDPAAAAATDTGLIVDPDLLRRTTPGGRAVLFRHETTHVALAAETVESMPRWLVEGFADYVGYAADPTPVPAVARELASRVRRSGVPKALPDDAQFTTATGAPIAYQLSWLACRLIATRYGQAALVRFYRDAAGGVDVAFRRLGITQSQFVTEWRAYVARQFR